MFFVIFFTLSMLSFISFMAGYAVGAWQEHDFYMKNIISLLNDEQCDKIISRFNKC